ncbi:MAG: glycosyltransferase family 4 protein [Bacteroidetes bacterium]|nr:glycosyltransferase family 4 protein [Bacteroidota bacterium]
MFAANSQKFKFNSSGPLKTKVTYIISNIDKALAFEWIAEGIDKEKIELSFILLNSSDSFLENYLIKRHFIVKRIHYKTKSDLPLTFLRVAKFLLKIKPDAVHTHLFEANLIGLSAAYVCGIKNRFYTRHHSSYHHSYFPKAVKYDRISNTLSTKIIAITSNVKEILHEKENVPYLKIVLIHHGFKLDLFDKVSSTDINNLKIKYGTLDHYPVIGVISRYTEWKGIQYIIPAFKKLLLQYPKAKLILANAQGDYKAEVSKQLQTIDRNNYMEIDFENNLFALYKLFDVFAHTPIDNHSEAFGQVYVEALASSVPSVFTLSGIANDFIEPGKNALVVPHQNSDEILEAIRTLLTNSELKSKLVNAGLSDVNKKFPLSKMLKELEQLYLQANYD